MSQRSRDQTLCLLLLILLTLLKPSTSLKCRTEDGPSDAELKRVTRSCMRKIGENARFGNAGGGSATNSGSSISNGMLKNNRYGQQYPSSYGQQQSNSNYDYDENDDNHNNSNGNHKNFERSDDILRQRNRDRMPMNYAGSQPNSNNERGGRFELSNNNGRSGNGGGNSGSGYGGHTNGNQRSSMQNGGNNNREGGSGNNNSNNFSIENACVVHCFFEELHMLNSDDFPDKHKVKYMLTKDLRNRELRNFYLDTIQECFHYLESQRKRDKCHYSRELISCMTEYAKANCDDWQEFNMIFN